MKRIITFGLLICLSLTACTVGIISQDALPMPNVGASPTPEATLLSTSASEDQATPTPAPPTPTPASTDSPAPTQAPTSPHIFSFEVTPTDVDLGDTVTLTWEVRGDQVTLCPGHRGSDDCWQVPQAGTTTFTLPTDLDSVSRFILVVQTYDSPSPAIAEATVRYKCDTDWFFSGGLYWQECPMKAIRSHAAVQHFERGTMIWIEQLGRYIILVETLMSEEGMQKHLYQVRDPLDIIRDTSAGIEPPEGLYAPGSGFGLIWRGDVRQSPGYRETLGWALEPEFGYEAVHQCTPGYLSGGIFWVMCYLQGPDDEVIYFHPLGGWYLLGE